MHKAIYSLIFIIFFSVSGKAQLPQVPQLSEQSKAIMFTCEPGSELYAGFGHSALWISDPQNGIDRLYNYGTFDFNTPNFYTKFIRGKLNYMLSVTNINNFLYEYQYRKIGVSGQELNLNKNEKQRLFALLEENAKPENRFYKYDFFYDNCATRIRDIVVDASEGEITFDKTKTQKSFRQLLFPYLKHTPWTKFGINLILGLTSDKKASRFDFMYLPEHMQNEFAQALIITDDTTRQLVAKEKRYIKSRLVFSYNVLTDPILIFSIIFLLIALLTYIEISRKSYFRIFDIILNSISIIAGLFLLFMWLGTDHIATNCNLNILWLVPAQSLYLISLFSKNSNNRKYLVWTAFGIITSLGFIIQVWPQSGEISFSIIALIFAMRYMFHHRTQCFSK
jgi:hypothetical protein